MPLLPEYKLHLTSRISAEHQAELKPLITRPDQVLFWHGASDDQYAHLLDTSTALVSASKFEGFGLPLLEAMVRGVPVVCSDIPIFREVCGDAALYFNPSSPEQFAHQVRALEDLDVRQKLIARGLAQSKKFNWDDSASAFLEIVQHIYEPNRL
jgi:glycosyltransferase involved in cell wall biosynthesis